MTDFILESRVEPFVTSVVKAKAHAPRFTHVPTLRSFESILTDDQLSKAGLAAVTLPSGKSLLCLIDSSMIVGSSHSSDFLAAAHVFPKKSPLGVTSIISRKFNPIAPSLKRIAGLEDLAQEEGELFNRDSNRHAKEWLESNSNVVIPKIFLAANGNTRFVWRNDDCSVGFQFLSNGKIQIVGVKFADGNDTLLTIASAHQAKAVIVAWGLGGVLGFDGQ